MIPPVVKVRGIGLGNHFWYPLHKPRKILSPYKGARIQKADTGLGWEPSKEVYPEPIFN